MEFAERERQSGLSVASVEVGLRHSRPLGHPHRFHRWGPLSAVQVQLPGSVSRGVRQLSRAAIRCGAIPVLTFPISWYKICVRTGVET